MSVSAGVKASLLGGLAALILTAQPAGAVEGGTILATVDRARLVKVPMGTETLIIGNPTIADVTLLKSNNVMVLTPKAFGETNFIALDHEGNPLAESTIQVVNDSDGIVVQRGMERESYSCAPRCQPTERLGDADKYLTAVAAQAQTHASRLAGVQAPTAIGTTKGQ